MDVIVSTTYYFNRTISIYLYCLYLFKNYVISKWTASISVTQGGTLPYAYLWDDLSAQTTSTATNLETGMYVVRVTDANGCQFIRRYFCS